VGERYRDASGNDHPNAVVAAGIIVI